MKPKRSLAVSAMSLFRARAISSQFPFAVLQPQGAVDRGRVDDEVIDLTGDDGDGDAGKVFCSFVFVPPAPCSFSDPRLHANFRRASGQSVCGVTGCIPGTQGPSDLPSRVSEQLLIPMHAC